MNSTNKTPGRTPHVVVIGGGFGGLEAVKTLAGTAARVTLIDASNHHLFQPLLYQVATSGLSPSEIAIPIRSVLGRMGNIDTLLARVTDIDLDNQQVELDDGSHLAFDYLVIATGARPTYFGNDHWRRYAPPLKSIENAVEVRRNILLAFERAERAESPEARRRELVFAVVGGGPTGVEIAGALIELSQSVLPRDFRRVRPEDVRVVLIEGGPRLLPGMSAESSAEAERALQEMGVEVIVDRMAKDIDEQGVHLDDQVVEAKTVVWAAGVTASELTKCLPVEKDRGGRLVVGRDCALPGHPRVFAVGDVARHETEEGVLPGVSPVAMQQGRYVAKKIRRDMKGQETAPFRYRDKGTMATIGRKRAVAETFGFKLRGYSAWLAWLFVHLFFLVGFKNRVFVLFQWIGSYAFHRRGARLITHSDQSSDPRRRRPLAAPGQRERHAQRA